MHAHVAGVSGPRQHARIAVHARPGLAGIVRPEHAGVARIDDREQARGPARRNGDADAANAIGLPRRQAGGELPPGGAAVGGLEQAAAGPAESRRSPTAPAAPATARRRRCRDSTGSIWHVDAAGVLVLVEHALEGRAAIDRAEDAALGVRTVRVPERGDEHAVGVRRIDHDLGNLLGVAQAEVRPRLAGVGGLVHAVAGGQVGPLLRLAGADVDHVGIGRRHGQRANRAGRRRIEDRQPRAPGVGGLPDAAVDDADVEGVRLAGHAVERLGAAGAMRADVSPLQFAEQRPGRAPPAPAPAPPATR